MMCRSIACIIGAILVHHTRKYIERDVSSRCLFVTDTLHYRNLMMYPEMPNGVKDPLHEIKCLLT